MPANSFTLRFVADLDLKLCLNSGQVFRWVEHNACWTGVDGQNWYIVQESATGEFNVASNTTEASFNRLFRLDLDYRQIQDQILQRGPELQPHIELLKGLRLMRPSSAHETLFCFLCTANNHLSRISQMVRKLAAYGEPIEEGFPQFPSVERIADIPESELRLAGFGYRAATIPRVAREIVARGDNWMDRLANARYEDARAELMALPSIGPKLADCICLYAFQFMESAPMDTHLWQAVCRHYMPEWEGKPLTDARYRAAADLLRSRFGEYTGFAHQYLYFENLLNWRTRK